MSTEFDRCPICKSEVIFVRQNGRITENFAACYGAFYVKEGER